MEAAQFLVEHGANVAQENEEGVNVRQIFFVLTTLPIPQASTLQDLPTVPKMQEKGCISS